MTKYDPPIKSMKIRPIRVDRVDGYNTRSDPILYFTEKATGKRGRVVVPFIHALTIAGMVIKNDRDSELRFEAMVEWESTPGPRSAVAPNCQCEAIVYKDVDVMPDGFTGVDGKPGSVRSVQCSKRATGYIDASEDGVLVPVPVCTNHAGMWHVYGRLICTGREEGYSREIIGPSHQIEDRS